jgi:hypothetical protein
MTLRSALGTLAAVTAIVGTISACSSASSDDRSATRETTRFGPPSDATEISAMGSIDLVTNLTFVVDGQRYLVHTAPTSFAPASPDSDRTATFEGEAGIEITATCGGVSESTEQTGEQVAGPLVVSWRDHEVAVSALSQDDTGACSPDDDEAERLLQMTQALPRLSAEEWNQLVIDHPVDLSGDS